MKFMIIGAAVEFPGAVFPMPMDFDPILRNTSFFQGWNPKNPGKSWYIAQNSGNLGIFPVNPAILDSLLDVA